MTAFNKYELMIEQVMKEMQILADNPLVSDERRDVYNTVLLRMGTIEQEIEKEYDYEYDYE